MKTGGLEHTASQAAISTRILRSVQELAALEPDWYALLEECPSHTVFSTPDWLIPLAQECQDKLQLLSIAVYQQGRLIGLAPLAVRRIGRLLKGLRFLGMGPYRYSWSDYQDILAARGKEQEAVRAVLGRLRQLTAEWDMMYLVEIPATSPTLAPLLRGLQELGWAAVAEGKGSSYILPLPQRWEDYLAALSVNFRKDFERKARKFQKDHQGSFHFLPTGGDLDAAMDTLVRLHTLQWQARGQPGIFAQEGMEGFLRSVARRMAARGALWMGILTGDTGTVGVSFNLRYRGMVYYYNSGFDPRDPAVRLSPGTLMNRYAIKEAIEAGDHYLNFLRGDGKYKARYGVDTLGHVQLRVWRNWPMFLADRAVLRLGRRAKGQLRRLLGWMGRGPGRQPRPDGKDGWSVPEDNT